MEELLRKMGFAIFDHILSPEYSRLMGEDEVDIDYQDFAELMNNVAKERSIRCKLDKRSSDCVMAVVVNQMHDPAGGANIRHSFTIIGADGRIINVNGCDNSQKIKILVQNPNGRAYCEGPSLRKIMERVRGVGYFQ